MAQTFQNHAKFVPPFHYFVLPMLAVNFVWHVMQMFRHFDYGTVIGSLTGLALIVLAFCARVFAVTVQDRVIRLEMRLRLQQLLSTDLRARIEDFTPSQLVALRFASDAELPDLARKVLDEKITNRKSIKGMVKTWQGDYLRA